MNRISVALISLTILCGGPALVAQQVQLPENPALKEQIRMLDLAHAEAIFKGDEKALEQLLPDDHTVNHPTNRIVQGEE